MHKKYIFFAIFFLANCGVSSSREEQNVKTSPIPTENEFLVFGDSLSTGAFTDATLDVDYDAIMKRVLGTKGPTYPEDPAERPQRLKIRKLNTSWFAGVGEGLAQSLMFAIESPELSWGSQLAKATNKKGSQLVIAARNGAQTDDAISQVEAWREENGKNRQAQLPPQVFFFFSGNDLCRPAHPKEPSTGPAQYKENLRMAIRTLMSKGKPHSRGTTIYLISHLDLLQLVRRPEILAGKTIHTKDIKGSRTLSCPDFINEYQDLATAPINLAYHPMNLCYNVLSLVPPFGKGDSQAKLKKLESMQKSYQDELKHLVDELQNAVPSGIHVKFIDATEKLAFASADMANDCFHLSGRGQEKVRRAIEEATR